MSWPPFHNDTPEGLSERRIATSWHLVIMAHWRRDYERQRPEVRKAAERRDLAGAAAATDGG